MVKSHADSKVFADEHWLVGSLVHTPHKATLQHIFDAWVIMVKVHSIHSLCGCRGKGLQCPYTCCFLKGSTGNSCSHSSMHITHILHIQLSTWDMVKPFGQHALDVMVLLWDPVKAHGAQVLTTRHATCATWDSKPELCSVF